MGELPAGLYSAVPKERVAALKTATPELRERLMSGLPSWPLFSPGSLNAWLVFLGPSPGNSPGECWNYDPLPSVGGAHGGVAEYQDGKGFWNWVRTVSIAVFSELTAEDAYAATMVRNLVPEQSAVGPQGAHMPSAAREALKVVGELIRPRLVISIGGARRYTDPVFRNVPGSRQVSAGFLYSSGQGNRHSWFALASNWPSGDPFLFVAPIGVHPSRRQVSLSDTMRFLREQSEVARSL